MAGINVRPSMTNLVNARLNSPLYANRGYTDAADANYKDAQISKIMQEIEDMQRMSDFRKNYDPVKSVEGQFAVPSGTIENIQTRLKAPGVAAPSNIPSEIQTAIMNALQHAEPIMQFSKDANDYSSAYKNLNLTPAHVEAYKRFGDESAQRQLANIRNPNYTERYQFNEKGMGDVDTGSYMLNALGLGEQQKLGAETGKIGAETEGIRLDNNTLRAIQDFQKQVTQNPEQYMDSGATPEMLQMLPGIAAMATGAGDLTTGLKNITGQGSENKPPSGFRWGPLDEGGNRSLIPYAGSKADYDREKDRKEAEVINASNQQVLSTIDRMIKNVSDNPRSTATLMAPLARGIEAVTGVFDPTGDKGPGIQFAQDRDNILGVARDLFAGGRLTIMQMQKIENALGGRTVTKPENTINALNEVKKSITANKFVNNNENNTTGNTQIPHDGTKDISKSGKPIVVRNGRWEYE